MNAMPSKPRLSAMLGQVATIARISKTSLGLRRLDKKASAQSDMAHNARQGTGKTTVSRLSGAEDRIKEINDIANEASAGLEAMTMRWGNSGGQRILDNASLQRWLAFYTPIKAKYDQKVQELIDDAPDLIEAAELNKGSYDVAVPTLEEFENAFSLTYEMIQIPDSETFQATGVSAQIEAEMKRHFEAGIEAAYQNAQTDALKRLAAPLANLVKQLTAFDQTEEQKARGVVSKSGRLYASLIGNITDIGAVFRNFNMTNDPFLDSIADKLEAFEGVDIEDVKESPDLRKDLTKRADDILAGLKDLI
jgi:hypothetical protein